MPSFVTAKFICENCGTMEKQEHLNKYEQNCIPIGWMKRWGEDKYYCGNCYEIKIPESRWNGEDRRIK
mgnify:CR=1 FL=1